MYGSEAVTSDNWEGATVKTAAVKATSRWTAGLTALKNEQTAEKAYETVLEKAGCSLSRDAVDTRIVGEVRNGKSTYKGSNGSTGGLIDTQSDVGGWPELKEAAARPQDSIVTVFLMNGKHSLAWIPVTRMMREPPLLLPVIRIWMCICAIWYGICIDSRKHNKK